MSWLLLILSLPTGNATARMRCWRALKTSGAAVLRDGVYLLPDQGSSAATLATVAEDLLANGGTARVLPTEDTQGDFAQQFDRGAEYSSLLAEVAQTQAALQGATVQDAVRQARRMRKAFEQLAAIDFFPGEAQRQTLAAVDALDDAIRWLQSPDEPQATVARVTPLRREDYLARTWATRKRPWVDRLASAWLIRRFIDPQARFVWIHSAADCPAHALGFDFDGAAFTHVGSRVTFETLLASFALETPAMLRLGLLVHGLDAGGVLSPESVGVERVLAGMRDAIADDDQLLQVAAGVFEGLLTTFEKDARS